MLVCVYPLTQDEDFIKHCPFRSIFVDKRYMESSINQW